MTGAEDSATTLDRIGQAFVESVGGQPVDHNALALAQGILL